MKRGRPRGLNVNPVAVEDGLKRECISKTELCALAGITPSHLSDMLHRQKGTSPQVVRAIADALRSSPGTIAPELTDKFRAVRPQDDDVDELDAAAIA